MYIYIYKCIFSVHISYNLIYVKDSSNEALSPAPHPALATPDHTTLPLPATASSPPHHLPLSPVPSLTVVTAKGVAGGGGDDDGDVVNSSSAVAAGYADYLSANLPADCLSAAAVAAEDGGRSLGLLEELFEKLFRLNKKLEVQVKSI